VQGERRVELVRALLSRSLHSPLHLKCNGKGTTFSNPFCGQRWPEVAKDFIFNIILFAIPKRMIIFAAVN